MLLRFSGIQEAINPVHSTYMPSLQSDSWQIVGVFQTVFDETEVLGLMPPPMARQIIKEVYADMLTNLLLFRGLDEEVIMKMCLELRPFSALEGEHVTVEGQLGTEIYIIQNGYCTVRHCPFIDFHCPFAVFHRLSAWFCWRHRCPRTTSTSARWSPAPSSARPRCSGSGAGRTEGCTPGQ